MAVRLIMMCHGTATVNAVGLLSAVNRPTMMTTKHLTARPAPFDMPSTSSRKMTAPMADTIIKMMGSLGGKK